MQAAEEVLVHLAQTRPQSSLVQRAIAAICKWLRENMPGFAKMKLSDGEIIEHYLVPARRFTVGTAERRKGRDWLRNMGANNTLRPQAKATLEAASAYDTNPIRNLPAFSHGGKEGIIRENNRRLTALRDTLKPVPNISLPRWRRLGAMRKRKLKAFLESY